MNKGFELRCLNCNEIITLQEHDGVVVDSSIAESKMFIVTTDVGQSFGLKGFSCQCGNEIIDE